MTVHNKQFEVYLSDEKIHKLVMDLADRISQDYLDKDPLLVAILNGSFVFASDLSRALDFDPEISFIKLASYNGTESSGKVNELVGLKENVKDRHVLIVEDIVDTGNTLEKIIKIFESKEVASVEIVSLLFKPDIYQKSIPVKYYGLDIPNKFVIGYGLDFDGRGRSLKDIYALFE
ncbi:MAG: hypoxanthine phosphoribosyltransferase [Cyclobacteriaceae bacterium]